MRSVSLKLSEAVHLPEGCKRGGQSYTGSMYTDAYSFTTLHRLACWCGVEQLASSCVQLDERLR